jgi:hypothetical protein
MKGIKAIEAPNDHREPTFRLKRDKKFTRLPVCARLQPRLTNIFVTA